MSLSLPVFAQLAPSATTLTTIYTVSQNKEFNLKRFYVCNRGAAAATFRFAISVGGAVVSNKDYIYYDVTIAGNDTFELACDIWLFIDDELRVYASTGDLSFTISGEEHNAWRIQ